MADLTKLAAANVRRWNAVTVERTAAADAVAKRLVAAKPHYQAVEAKTGVPWFVIAVIHQRESSQNWKGSLAQGDPWNRKSVNVPRGRGPFSSWEEAAIDALVNCHPFLARRKDWSLSGTLLALEMYNGVGYANKGVPSPYLWAGTSEYKSGKYVRDGRYDPNHVDQQLGVVALLRSMIKIDPSIKIGAPVPVAATPAKPEAKPSGGKKAATAVVVGGAVAAQQAHSWGFSSGVIVGVVVAALIVGVIGFLVWRAKKA